MKILLFSDLHNFDEEKLNKINIDPDLIIFLGDIKGRTLDQIIINFPNKTYFGVLGNHDEHGLFRNINTFIKLRGGSEKIQDANKNLLEFNGITFTGLEGCVNYGRNHVGYDFDDEIVLPKADILISHEGGYLDVKNNLNAHQGYPQLSEYRKEFKPKYHFFGHQHVQCEFIKDNVNCYCVYQCALFDFENKTYEKIF